MAKKKGSKKKKNSRKGGAAAAAKAPAPPATKEATAQKTLATKEPPFSCKVVIGRAVMRVQVTLHRTPPKTIKFEPTSEHFYLDTLEDTRKYLLKFPYPHGIKVSVDPEPEASLEYGILKVDLPIVDFGSLKKKRSAFEKKTGASQVVAKTLVNKPVPKIEAPTTTATSTQKAQKPKQRKTFVNKAQAVDLLSQIASQEEAKIHAFVQKEAASEKRQKEKRKKTEAKKRKREAIKEDSRQSIKKKIKLDKAATKDKAKPKPKKKAGQVRFADEE